jgi:hypothetical protein
MILAASNSDSIETAEIRVVPFEIASVDAIAIMNPKRQHRSYLNRERIATIEAQYHFFVPPILLPR